MLILLCDVAIKCSQAPKKAVKTNNQAERFF